MVLHKCGSDPWVTEQKISELFGENVVTPHGVPRFTGHFRFFVRGGWNRPEAHFGHTLYFVVIVKDNAAKASDAKVFIEHVARKNIGGGQFADGLAILLDG